MEKNRLMDWILRFVKGMFIGTGFILPGVSGGALAAVFGIYERLIGFIAHLTREFKKNLLFFLPVGLGLLAGVILLSFPLNYFLETYEAQMMWFFVGCIVGTLPALWKQANKKGRKPYHYAIVAVVTVSGYFLLRWLVGQGESGMAQNFGTWTLAGAIVALGMLVPGLSPSNLLVLMGMYSDMTAAIKTLDFSVLLPLALGGLACILALSKLVEWLLGRVYAGMFHIILGVVLASTLMIIPLNYNYISLGGLVCLVLLAAGTALGLWMGRLEAKYKPDDLTA